MATERQREAARRNGAKSHGPITAAGKQKSAMNSSSHGLTGRQVFLFGNENPEAFSRLLQAYEATFEPANQAEHDLVKIIALEQFRQRRWYVIETAALDIEMDKLHYDSGIDTTDEPIRQAAAFLQLAERSNGLQLINRYLTSSRRAYERSMRLLLELQERRRTASVSEPDTSSRTASVSETDSSSGTASVSESDTSPTTASVSETDYFLQNEPSVEKVAANQPSEAAALIEQFLARMLEAAATQAHTRPPSSHSQKRPTPYAL